MSEPRWIAKQAVFLLHAESLAEHGGAEGIRDEGALESALVKPINQYTYAGTSDMSVLAAAYAAGLSRNHPFLDGNIRAAFITICLVLALNWLRLVATQVDAARVMLALAAGQLSEAELAEWVQSHLEPR